MSELVHISCPLCRADGSSPHHAAAPATFVKCAACGLIFQNPRPKNPISVSAEMTESGVEFFTEKGFSERKQKYYRVILNDLASFRQTGQLLEIGCASGGFLLAARNAGWRAVGVEISDAAARIGREKHGLEIITGDIAQTGFAAGRFDVAVMNMVVEHLADPVRTLEEVARTLRVGGTAWIHTPNYDSPTILRNAEPQYFPPDHYVLFTPATIRAALDAAGFLILKITTRGYRQGEKKKRSAIARFLDRIYAPIAGAFGRGHRIKVLAVKK